MEQDNINQPLILGSEGNQESVMITNEELLSSATNELNRDVSQKSQEEIDILTEEFKKDKEEYANNKSAGPALEKKVVQTGARIVQGDQFRQELSKEVKNEKKNGNVVNKFSKLATDFNNIIKGNLETTYENNQPGYQMIDGWKSQQQILEMIKNNQVDQKSKEGFKILLDNQTELAEQANEIEGANFNYKKEYNNIMQKMVETGDIRSLATDKIFSERVFKDDLMESISSGTYGDLGLSEEQVKKMDPTPNDNITPEDASYITSAIIKDEDMLKPYLAEYYTKALEQNYYTNLNPDVRSAMDSENKKNEISIKTQGIPVKGGTIQNGVFIPNAKKA